MTTITIRKVDGEYRVPGMKGETDAYYTNDKADAVGTAKAMHPGATIKLHGKVVG